MKINLEETYGIKPMRDDQMHPHVRIKSLMKIQITTSFKMETLFQRMDALIVEMDAMNILHNDIQERIQKIEASNPGLKQQVMDAYYGKPIRNRENR